MPTDVESPMNQPHKRATIYDIAARAGVSASTASRALNKPGMLSEATQVRVMNAAEELGYEVNRAARGLTSGKTGVLGLLIGDISNPYGFGLLNGAEAEADRAGYVLVTSATGGSRESVIKRVRSLTASVDAFILAAAQMEEEVIDFVASRRPVVTINRDASVGHAVHADTQPALAKLLAQASSQGHQHVAYVGGPKSAWPDPLRWDAIYAAALDNDMRATHLGPHEPTRAAGEAAWARIEQSGASLVIAYNDLLAIGVMAAARAHGRSVPTDLSVAGIDNIVDGTLTTPELTTIAAPLEDMGAAAVRHAAALVRGEQARSRVESFPAALIERDSVGPARLH